MNFSDRAINGSPSRSDEPASYSQSEGEHRSGMVATQEPIESPPETQSSGQPAESPSTNPAATSGANQSGNPSANPPTSPEAPRPSSLRDKKDNTVEDFATVL